MRPLAVLLLLLAAGGGADAGDGPSVETLRREVQRALKINAQGEQASAVAKAFDGHDSAAAAEVAIGLVFDREIPQRTLEAAMLAVARMQDPGVVPALRRAAEEGTPVERVRAVEALGRSEASGSAGSLVALSVDPAPWMRTAVATALGRKDEAVASAAEDLLADPVWTVRSAAIATLSRLRVQRAVPALCRAMRASEGRLVDDCVMALRTITGERFGADPARYEGWFAQQEGKAPTAAPDWSAPAGSLRSPLLFTRSRRILFMLSTAETMKDPVSGAAGDDSVAKAVAAAGADLLDDLKAAKTKLDAARVHLRAMLRTLEDGVEFDVLVYSGSPTFAFGGMTAADASTRRKAETRIASLSPGGRANLHGALVRAFDPHGKDPMFAREGPDTIVLFTDGALEEPGSEDATEVAGAAVRWNAVRQIRFLVIAVGQTEPSVVGRLAAGPPEGGTASVP